MTTQLSEAVVNRLDHVVDTDPACIAALDAFYCITARLEATDPNLFHELDQVWIDAFCTTREAVWLDGWQCGQQPALLVFEPMAPAPEPIAVDWREVAPGVAIGVSASDAVEAWLSGGAQ